jgi:hypothetical protein
MRVFWLALILAFSPEEKKQQSFVSFFVGVKNPLATRRGRGVGRH